MEQSYLIREVLIPLQHTSKKPLKLDSVLDETAAVQTVYRRDLNAPVFLASHAYLEALAAYFQVAPMQLASDLLEAAISDTLTFLEGQGFAPDHQQVMLYVHTFEVMEGSRQRLQALKDNWRSAAIAGRPLREDPVLKIDRDTQV